MQMGHSTPRTALTNQQVRLRIGLASDCQVASPGGAVDPSPVPATAFHLDFQVEKGVIEAAAAGRRAGPEAAAAVDARGGAGGAEGAGGAGDHESLVSRFVSLGLAREPVVLALAAVGAEDPTKVADFCKHYEQMRGMGFPPAAICGALSLHNMDLNAAISSCLAHQG